MGRTRMLGRAPALALVLAGLSLSLAACGAGRTGATDAGPAPSRATTTEGAAGTGEGSEPAGPATGGDESGESAASGGSGPAGTTQVSLYFIRGEQLAKVTRAVPRVTRIGAEAVKTLLVGPTAEERRAGLSTAIPASTEFRNLVIEGGVARVDLSGAFESGGGGLGLILRLAQVTCTLDAFPTVNGVRFALDGQLRDVLSGDGVVVDRPVTCDSYRDYLEGSPPAVPTFAGIWPFTTAADMEAYARGGEKLFTDPASTAQEFAKRYLGFGTVVSFAYTISAGQADIPVGFGTGEGGVSLPDPRPTTIVRVRQLVGEGFGSPWTVVGARSDQIVVDEPGGAIPRIASPLRVTGRASAFEGTVQVEVREDGMAFGQSLGKGFVTGRGDGVLGPFSGEIRFRRPTKPAGAVVFFEQSAVDGSTLRATVVRVAF
ncbi:MAG: GerMN domain-containing protein [Actinomycetota bacterium]|nr:GerMN domain-containing protein [Actinomycetota bacterium]